VTAPLLRRTARDFAVMPFARAPLVEVLKRCGDDLTRDNVMKVVANMDFEINTYIPGIRIKTSPTDFYPIEQVQMMRFTGEKWQLFGPVIDGHAE
jgi:branched-chain amino acid transport system substrate-binding protein